PTGVRLLRRGRGLQEGAAAHLERLAQGIQRHGLLCSKSKGRLKAVWLATAGKSSWAAMHVAWRHGARIEAVLTLEIDVPRSWLRRSRKGLWYCTRDIPPAASDACSASSSWRGRRLGERATQPDGGGAHGRTRGAGTPKLHFIAAADAAAR